MIEQTIKLSNETAKRHGFEAPTILGVTLLTSFGQKTLHEELNVTINIDDYVQNLAKTAIETNLQGVVASASEAKKIREISKNKDFLIVCPAIRPLWAGVDDQVRVVTPSDAIKSGVDFMVIGRPVTKAHDKIEAINLIINEIDDAIIKV